MIAMGRLEIETAQEWAQPQSVTATKSPVTVEIPFKGSFII